MSLRSEIVRVLNEILGNSKKMSELTSLPTNVDNDDIIEVVRDGENYKATGSQFPSGGGGGGTWGAITGTITDQTDLVTYVDNEVGVSASETVKGVVEEATDAEIVSASATGATGAKLIITPAKFKTYCEPETSSGTAIQFDRPRNYGITTPLTGSLTLDTDDFKVGMVQLIVHNDSAEPTYPSEWSKLGGAYVNGDDNYYYVESLSLTKMVFTISQVL